MNSLPINKNILDLRCVVYIRRSIYTFLNVCPFDYTAAGSGKVGPVNHTSLVAEVPPNDRPKSVRNRCEIEICVGVFVLSLCPFEISVGIGAFVIGLSQISGFFLFVQLMVCKFWQMLPLKYILSQLYVLNGFSVARSN